MWTMSSKSQESYGGGVLFFFFTYEFLFYKDTLHLIDKNCNTCYIHGFFKASRALESPIIVVIHVYYLEQRFMLDELPD